MAKLIAFEDALAATLANLEPLPGEELAPLAELVGRIPARDLIAPQDVPVTDVSLKDGYAVHSADVAQAARERPVQLRLVGEVAAGGAFTGRLGAGETVRILSGAPLPEGADAILAEEFTTSTEGIVTALADAAPGRNILNRGTDLEADECLAPAGTVLRPAQVGLLAAAGFSQAPVRRRPRVALIATGDELIAPMARDSAGTAPGAGTAGAQVHPSNLATMAAWCRHFGMQTTEAVIRDDASALRAELLKVLPECDAVLTSGGAWTSERDLVVSVLEELEWREVYHHVRLGPGKGVGFGILQGRAVFVLPGGPASNQMAFLQLALPGLHRLMGLPNPGLPTRPARLTTAVSGQRDWTEYSEGRFSWEGTELCFTPAKGRRRLRAMAGCEGYVKKPEGLDGLAAGTVQPVQALPDVPSLEACPTQRRGKPPVVSFVAWSGTGKTTFLERLLPELKALGLQVGVVKHHAHATSFDVPGKDTYRMTAAGADIVLGVGAVQTAAFVTGEGANDIAQAIERHLGGMDLVIIEGFKRGRYPKVEIYRADWAAQDGRPSGLLCSPDEMLALVTDTRFPLPESVAQFALEDFGSVAEFLAHLATD